MSEIKKQIDILLERLAQQEEDLRLARLMLQRANTEVTLYGKAPHRLYRHPGLAFETDSSLVSPWIWRTVPSCSPPFGASRFSQRRWS